MQPDRPLAKPEEQIDPLAQIIELLGSLGPNEQFWFQILVRAHRGEKFASRRTATGGKYSVKELAHDEIKKIRDRFIKTHTIVDPQTGTSRDEESFSPLTRGAQNTMEAIERKISKPLFDVGLRALYTAPSDSYQGIMVTHLIALLRPFADETMNNFGIARWFAFFDDWPWEDTKGVHHAHAAHGLVDAYRRRSYFVEPYIMPSHIMNGEELATLYHIPSSGVTTPSLPRIQSATSEAPSNLPV